MSYLAKQALFIAFEGTDGAGKSTVARATYDKIYESHSELRYVDKIDHRYHWDIQNFICPAYVKFFGITQMTPPWIN